jgi:hypothetical protein
VTAPDLSAAIWRKSARSGGTGGNCVEVARNLPAIVAVRDSKNPHGPALTFSRHDWKAFTTSIRDGQPSPG